MIVKFDSLNRMELPRFFLCNPSSTYEDGRLTDVIGGIVNTEAEENIFNFNSMSELNLRVNCPEDSAPSTESSVLEVYNAIANRRLIYIPDIGYFVITHVDETREENYKYKDISAQSLEKEIEQKEVPFIEDGTYPFLTTSVKEGLFTQLMQVVPSWTVAHVDSTVAERYRTFEDVGTDINCYSFMINDLQDAYECIFEFDSIHRQVSVYDKANYVHKTNIHISNEDIIDVLKISDDSEDLYTAITVAGDADMGIGPVNPLGTNTIYNFSHYYSWMSSGLRTKLQQWAEDVAAAKTQYGTLNQSFYTELQNNSTLRLNIEAVDTQIEMYKRCRDNIVASQAGEEEANEHTVDMTELYNEAIEALGGDTIVVSIAEQISEILADIDALIAAAEAEKATLQADLDTSTATLSSLSASISAIVNSLALTSVLSQSEYEELSKYIFEGSYTDEYITITESMTYPERLAQMTTLYDRAVSQLEMISRPKQEFTVDVESFIFEKEFADWTAQLETGCLIDTEINENETASLFLSAITVNYDDKSMSLTFGSRYDKYDTASLFNDVLGSVSKSANSINYIKDQIYPIKVGQIDELREAIENARNLSMTNALTAQNQAFMIDGAGITGRKVNENNLSGFDDKQVKMTSNLIVFTDDAWQTCKVAIGDLGDGNYGVNAETIIGNLIIGNDLVLSGILRSANDTFVLNMETGELTMTPLWSDDIDNAVSGVESDLNSAVTNLQNQIDGAIETYSGTTAPTLNNYPASDWSADDYAAHAGDLFVGDSGSAIQGFWYRFQYNNTTGVYEWVQLRDNDIQKAIQDAADAVSTANGAASDASAAISTANSAAATANGSVQQADVEYYKSTSATSLSGGSWQTSSPQWEEGYYIWTRTKFTPAVGSVWYSTAVCITGNTGASGANGVSITGVIEHYAINNSSTTAPSSGWQTPPTDPIPMPTSSNRYLWNYETITYSSGASTDTTKKVIAIYTEDGRSITGVTNWYLATNTSTASDLPTKGASPWTTTVQNPSSSAKYLWNYEVITYSTGNPTVTDPCIIGNYAADGNEVTVYSVVPSVYAIVKNDTTFTPTYVEFTATKTTGAGTPESASGYFVIETSTDGTTYSVPSSDVSRTSNYARYTPSGSVKFVRCKFYASSSSTAVLDQETVAVVSNGTNGDKGDDAYTVILTNENHTFAGDNTKALTGQSAVCNVLVYKGTVQKSVTSITNTTTLPTGLTFTSTTGTNASFTVGIHATNAMTTKSGTLNITINADGQTFNKIFSYSLALAGSNGADGENFNWNLLRNTEHFDGWTNCGSGTAGEFDNSAGTFTFPSATGWTEIRPNINIPYSTVRNQTIVLSAEVKGESGAVISVMIDPFLSATETGERAKYRNCYLNTTGSSTTGEVTVIATGEWQKVFTAPISLTDSWFSSGSGTIDYDNCYFAARVARMGTNGHTGIGIPYVVRKPKIELGEKVSAWSPARDDINGANGKDGVGIESIEELYYCSESSETPSAPTSVDDISDNVSFDADTVVAVPNTSTGGSISVAVTNNSSPVSGGEIVHFGKNLLMQIRKSTYSSYGVTVTYNEDGSMTFNGTSTGTGYPNIANTGSIYQDATPFIGKSLTFSIEGAETGIGFYMTITTAADGTYRTITNSVSARTTTFTVASGDIGFRCGLRFNSGYTFNNVTVKPMLRVASDTDTTWAPFAYETKTLSSEGTAMFNAYGGSDTFYSSGNMTSAYASVYERWVRSAPAWTTRQRYFCTCSQINFDDGTVRWTDPVGNAAYAMLSEAVDNLNNAVGGLGDVASTTQIAELQSQLESLRDTGLFNQFIVDNDGVHITFGTGQDSGEIFMDGANVKFLINNELKAYINADGFNFDYGILTTALTIGKADSTGGTWTWMKAASGHFRLVYRG